MESSSPNSQKAGRIAEAKQRAATIKAQQEERLASLPINTLCIYLKNRSDSHIKNDFHWGYYFHVDRAGGMKHHATNESKAWIAEHVRTNGLLKELMLCVIIDIARVPPELHAELDRQLGVFDGCMNDEIPGIAKMNCRTWLKEVLKGMMQAGVVKLQGNVEELEAECLEIGNRFGDEAAANVQPRPVVKSALCCEN